MHRIGDVAIEGPRLGDFFRSRKVFFLRSRKFRKQYGSLKRTAKASRASSMQLDQNAAFVLVHNVIKPKGTHPRPQLLRSYRSALAALATWLPLPRPMLRGLLLVMTPSSRRFTLSSQWTTMPMTAGLLDWRPERISLAIWHVSFDSSCGCSGCCCTQKACLWRLAGTPSCKLSHGQ